jgi:hypothetical protein
MDSNLGHVVGYPELFRGICHSFQRISEEYFEIGHDRLFPNPYLLTIHGNFPIKTSTVEIASLNNLRINQF